MFGEGAHDARLLLIGEAPGAHEDETGRPFVGRSGQLLRTLLHECGVADSAYITNLVKCRPPNNRNPRRSEIDACSLHLRSQLELSGSVVVVTLGNFATRYVLDTKEGITGLRGRAYPWAGRTVVPTYHPAAALRQGSAVRDDMRSDLGYAASLLQETA